MRYLALDLGGKRVGMAVGDAQTRIVTPAGMLEGAWDTDRAGLIAAVARAIDDVLGRSPGALVIGLPLNMDDTEGPAARKVREIGAALGKATGRIVHYQDERLTSAAADWSMARSGLTRGAKKARRDALAAAAILRDFLDRFPANPSTGLPDPP